MIAGISFDRRLPRRRRRHKPGALQIILRRLPAARQYPAFILINTAATGPTPRLA
jgi:hypothetical protein